MDNYHVFHHFLLISFFCSMAFTTELESVESLQQLGPDLLQCIIIIWATCIWIFFILNVLEYGMGFEFGNGQMMVILMYLGSLMVILKLILFGKDNEQLNNCLVDLPHHLSSVLLGRLRTSWLWDLQMRMFETLWIILFSWFNKKSWWMSDLWIEMNEMISQHLLKGFIYNWFCKWYFQ